MKRLLKPLLLLAAAIITFEVGNYAYQMLSIAAGYNAKTLCSCVFVSGRPVEDVLAQDIAVSKSGFLGGSVDMEDQSASSGFLFIKKKAIYRPGVGCTIVNGVSEEELRAQNHSVSTPMASADSLQWPYGSLDTLAMPTNVDLAQVQKAIDYTFAEPPSENPRHGRAALIIYKGKIVGERYGDGIKPRTPLLGWSMTKSVTNTLVGMRVMDGALDLDAPADVPSWHTTPNDPRAKITLNDLMHMTSGLAFGEEYGGPSDVNNMLWREASAARIPEQSKLAFPINTHWAYSSGTTNIISEIIRRSFDSDDEYNEYVDERLLHPLDIWQSATIERDASGTIVGSSFMYASARDWAKWGLLYLNDGIWNGERLLPEGWVDYARTRTPVNEAGTYTAQFWTNGRTEENGKVKLQWPDVPEDAYYASGFEGQVVMIIPSLDMVLVRLGCTADRSNWDLGRFASLAVAAVSE